VPEDSGGEKTLAATPLKKQRAREKGNVAKSQDLSSGLGLLTALLGLWFLGATMRDYLIGTMAHYIGLAGEMDLTPDSIGMLVADAVMYTALITVPFMVLMLLAGMVSNLLQVGFLFAPSSIMPKFEKLNPITGMSRFFSVRSLVELVKSVLKLLLIGMVVHHTLRGRWAEVMTLSHLTPGSIVEVLSSVVMLTWFRVCLVVLALGLLDFAFQRWQWERDLRMTAQEMKEEVKDMEGDPRIKQRVRQIQRQMAMQRMMAEVPTADVVITNPTTYAVALRYNMAEMEAPEVIAKGARLLAERIRAIATENDVPIVEKPELARALYRTVEVSQPVPEKLFRGVAEVLRFVYEIDRRAEKLRERQAFMASIRPAAG
jgi:flagellar biosynthesis protein FlhB